MVSKSALVLSSTENIFLHYLACYYFATIPTCHCDFVSVGNLLWLSLLKKPLLILTMIKEAKKRFRTNKTSLKPSKKRKTAREALLYSFRKLVIVCQTLDFHSAIEVAYDSHYLSGYNKTAVFQKALVSTSWRRLFSILKSAG